MTTISRYLNVSNEDFIVKRLTLCEKNKKVLTDSTIGENVYVYNNNNNV